MRSAWMVRSTRSDRDGEHRSAREFRYRPTDSLDIFGSLPLSSGFGLADALSQVQPWERKIARQFAGPFPRFCYQGLLVNRTSNARAPWSASEGSLPRSVGSDSLAFFHGGCS